MHFRAYDKLTIEVGLTTEDKREKTTNWAFELPPLKLSKASEVVVGGVPSGKKLPPSLASKNFIGAIDHVKINGIVKGVWNWEVSLPCFNRNQWRAEMRPIEIRSAKV